MHLPLLHISSRSPFELPRDEDPFRLGQIVGRDLIPWLADPEKAISRAKKRRTSLDIASLGLAALGSEVTYFALISGLFSGYDRKTALLISSVILPSVALNQVFKARFRFARPPSEAQHKYAFVAPGDFTFPSGHAQNAVTLGLFIAQRAKRPWIRLAGILFAVNIPLSRVYLGVHYPRDVWAGAMLGLISIAGVNLLERPFRTWWQSSRPGGRGFTAAAACAILSQLTGSPLAAFPVAVGGGLALGQDLADSLKLEEAKPRLLYRIGLGIAGMATFMGTGFAIRPLMKRENTVSASLAGGIVGLSMTFGIPLISSILRRSKHLLENRRKRKKKRRKPLHRLDW